MSGERSFVRHIETLFDAGAIGEQTDRQLLERFTGSDRTAAELAFTVLVRRHGPMVFRACRAILGDPHAAEDAFQATFLVLARKASGLWVRGSLGPWLLAVACRTASCARITASRRRMHEREAAEQTPLVVEDQPWDDRDAVLYEELGRLPETYRMALVLCDLEGLTQEQAARRLGWPDGTVRSRLARGRERLRDRLTRRGLAPGAIFAGPSPRIEVPSASLVETAVLAALGITSGRAILGATASAVASMEGVLKTMFWGKIKLVAMAVCASALLCGMSAVGYRALGRMQATAPAIGTQPGSRVKPARKPDAPATPDAELATIGKARIETARKLRDATRRLYEKGEISVVEYLTAQRRFDEIVFEVMARTDADRIQFFERQVAGAKQLENRLRELHRGGLVTESEVLTVELYRLDAEYALAKFKAKVGPAAK